MEISVLILDSIYFSSLNYSNPLLPFVLSSQNAQRLGGSQVAQSLTTPVVSVATPSLLAPFPGMQTAYNTGETWKAALAHTSRRDVLTA